VPESRRGGATASRSLSCHRRHCVGVSFPLAGSSFIFLTVGSNKVFIHHVEQCSQYSHLFFESANAIIAILMWTTEERQTAPRTHRRRRW